MNCTQHDYTGKTIYIGIDVHKKTYCCVCVCDGEVIRRAGMPATPQGLVQYVHHFFKGATIKTAYEAGFSGFYLHRYLHRHGIDNIVVHPGSIEVSLYDRVKTDRRDACRIALQLSTCRLKAIYVPPEEQESKRCVSRFRQSTLELRRRVGNQLKSVLLLHNLIDLNDHTKISSKWIIQKLSELKEQKCPDGLMYIVEMYVEQWTSLTDQLKQVKQKLKQQSLSDRHVHELYESVPGIGLIHGCELANELGDMKQFLNIRHLFSFIGLTPGEYSSGDHIRRGSITRQGRPVLRKILIEAAWIAITKDANLKIIYERIAQNRGSKRAIVGIARRLVGRIRACLLNNTRYEIQ